METRLPSPSTTISTREQQCPWNDKLVVVVVVMVIIYASLFGVMVVVTASSPSSISSLWLGRVLHYYYQGCSFPGAQGQVCEPDNQGEKQ